MFRYLIICLTLVVVLNSQLIKAENPCQQTPDSGPCYKHIKAWFYDFDLGFCLPFSYGGCHGNDNNFPSKRLCERECAQRGNYGGGQAKQAPGLKHYSLL